MRGHYQRFGGRRERYADSEAHGFGLADVELRDLEVLVPRALHDAHVMADMLASAKCVGFPSIWRTQTASAREAMNQREHRHRFRL